MRRSYPRRSEQVRTSVPGGAVPGIPAPSEGVMEQVRTSVPGEGPVTV